MADRPQLSPRALGEAIGVSQSSLKRWADRGLLRVHRTAGGHRRIDVREALRFIREVGFTVVRPEILGIVADPVRALEEAKGDPPVDRLRRALVAGDEKEARALILSLFAAGCPLADLFDQIFRPALAAIGELWLDDPHGIAVEHRATDICGHIIGDLRGRIDQPARNGVAIGGAPAGDPYHLPSAMVCAALGAEGFRAVNLGANFPVAGLAEAAVRERARFVWVSVTHVTRTQSVCDEIHALSERLNPHSVPVIVGGSAHRSLGLAVGDGITTGDSISDVVEYARGLAGRFPAR